MFRSTQLSKTARSALRTFTTQKKSEDKYATILAPAVLATTVVIGIYNMQSVTTDIQQQTHYEYKNISKSV